MNCFFVYEEYGAKYEMMIKDIAAAHRTLPQWDMYQKGLETLASSLGCSSKHGDQKKSLTIGDLLVKVNRFYHEADTQTAGLTFSADTASVQVPTTLRRTVEVHTSNRLSTCTHGNREYPSPVTRSNISDQPGHG